jgi:hypothetical protein
VRQLNEATIIAGLDAKENQDESGAFAMKISGENIASSPSLCSRGNNMTPTWFSAQRIGVYQLRLYRDRRLKCREEVLQTFGCDQSVMNFVRTANDGHCQGITERNIDASHVNEAFCRKLKLPKHVPLA